MQKIKETGGKRKHRGGGDDGDDQEVHKYLGVNKKGKQSKKPKRK